MTSPQEMAVVYHPPNFLNTKENVPQVKTEKNLVESRKTSGVNLVTKSKNKSNKNASPGLNSKVQLVNNVNFMSHGTYPYMNHLNNTLPNNHNNNNNNNLTTTTTATTTCTIKSNSHEELSRYTNSNSQFSNNFPPNFHLSNPDSTQNHANKVQKSNHRESSKIIYNEIKNHAPSTTHHNMINGSHSSPTLFAISSKLDESNTNNNTNKKRSNTNKNPATCNHPLAKFFDEKYQKQTIQQSSTVDLDSIKILSNHQKTVQNKASKPVKSQFHNDKSKVQDSHLRHNHNNNNSSNSKNNNSSSSNRQPALPKTDACQHENDVNSFHPRKQQPQHPTINLHKQTSSALNMYSSICFSNQNSSNASPPDKKILRLHLRMRN